MLCAAFIIKCHTTFTILNGNTEIYTNFIINFRLMKHATMECASNLMKLFCSVEYYNQMSRMQNEINEKICYKFICLTLTHAHISVCANILAFPRNQQPTISAVPKWWIMICVGAFFPCLNESINSSKLFIAVEKNPFSSNFNGLSLFNQIILNLNISERKKRF